MLCILGDDFLSVFKTRALVLKNQEYKENDRLLWLYTEKLGRISAIAHGARKSKSKFTSCTLPFCYGEYVIFKGKSLYTLNEAQLEESFQIFLNDLENLTYASYINELIEISCIEEESNRELFKSAIITLYLMKNKVGDLNTLIRAFEIKLLSFTGYGLNLEYCSICGKKLERSNMMDTQYYGAVCGDCKAQGTIKVSYAAINALKYLIKTPLEKIYILNLSEDIKLELEELLSIFIKQSYSKKTNSLDFLKLLRSDKNE